MNWSEIFSKWITPGGAVVAATVIFGCISGYLDLKNGIDRISTDLTLSLEGVEDLQSQAHAQAREILILTGRVTAAEVMGNKFTEIDGKQWRRIEAQDARFEALSNQLAGLGAQLELIISTLERN